MHFSAVQLKNNCTNNSQIIAQGKAECDFDFYEYNNSLIALKCMRLSTNHIVLPMILSPYSPCSPVEAHLLISLLLYSSDMFII